MDIASALTPEQTFRKYTTHTLLFTFGRALFASYGTLLIYARTESVFWTLMFWTISYGAGFLMRTVGVRLTWNFLRRRGAPTYMGLGIVLASVATALMSLLDPSAPSFLFILVLSAALFQIGMSMYWVLSNAILYSVIGALGGAGKHTSFVSIAKRFASVLAAAVGVTLSGTAGFTWLLPMSAILSLVSILPLRGMHLEVQDRFSVRASLAALSGRTILANIRITPSLEAVGLPLILLLIGLSLQTSVWVGGLAIAASMIVAYVAGILEDKNSRGLSLLALALAMGAWAGYAFASVPSLFVFLGFLWSVAATVIEIDGDARLCREVTNTGHPIEETVALEAMRVGGLFLGSLILVGTYAVLHSLPQTILLLGVIVVLPQGIYALGGIEEGSALRKTGAHGGAARHCTRHVHHPHIHGHHH